MVTYARMVTEATFEEIPSEVIAYDKLIILDTIGAMLGGSGMDGIPQVVELVRENGGKPESNIILYGGKVPAAEAGMAIGPMARAVDWSTIHPEAMHTSEHTLPTLLAALGLRKKVSGKEFLTAFVMGQEVLVRIGNAWRPTQAVASGRSNGHYIFGSTAAAAKLLGLNQEQLLNAFGIVRSMTQPHDMAAFHPMTHMVKIHHGFICQDSINACRMAQKGITGPHDQVITGQRGYLNMAGWPTAPEELWKDLGVHWDQLRLESKSYPGCKSTTTAVMGTWRLMEENHISPDQIEQMYFYMPHLSMEMLEGPLEEKLNPQNEYDCQFSLPYMISVAVHDGKIEPKSYWKESRQRQRIRDFMPRVHLEENDALKPWATDIRIEMKDGSVYTWMSQPESIRGSLENPFTTKDYVEKFKILATYSVYPLSEEKVDRLIDTILHLENCDDVVRDLILPLTPGGEG